MKKALCALLLFGLLLSGCQSIPKGEAMAVQNTSTLEPTPDPTPTLEPTPVPTPIPPRATEMLSISAAPVTPSPTVPPTPSPTPTATPEPTPFTLVWIADTQNYSRNQAEVFNAMRDWILNNREKENIQFVAHTGDVVDGFSQAMWDNAANALVPIFEALPGMVVSGNHDVFKDGNQWYFTHQPYAQLVQKEGQTYRDGDAAYVTFHAAGTDFLVFGIGYSVSCPDWMNQVIAEHPDHVVITVIHSGLTEDGNVSGPMKTILQNVAPQAPGFRLMLCGHMRGSATRIDWFDDDQDGEKDRSVTTMMFNYQEDRIDSLGFMRLLRFDPMIRSIEVLTYSPWFDQWGYPKASEQENHFILENAW